LKAGLYDGRDHLARYGRHRSSWGFRRCAGSITGWSRPGAAHVDPFEGTSTAKARRVRSREPDVEVTASAIVKGSLDDRPHKSRISSPGQLWPPRERVPVRAAPMTPLCRLRSLPWRSH